MNQVKIGKFIAERRKAKNFTQMQLAEKLNITDRAVSKWERGKSMPDAAIMLDLCALLDIGVNELLMGEIIMENKNEKTEQLLLDMAKQKEQADKRLLSIEIVVGALSMFSLLSLTFIASFVQMADWLRIVLIILGFIPCMVGIGFALKIEQTAGYYECAKCHYRYVPTFSSVLWAAHVNRTRYMKCPKCNQKSWQKKVLTKD